MEWAELERMAREEILQTVASLPADLKARATALPIVCERAPSQAIIDDGFEPNILGLFVGHDFAHEEQAIMPAQILLFLENIWEMVESDEEEFRFEVRTTLMHELGHYLGLDEDDLDERGLL